MVEYGDLSDDAKWVLNIIMIYPHSLSSKDGVKIRDDWPYENNRSFCNGLIELENSGLIEWDEVAQDRIVTPLAYQIIPKDILVNNLDEARNALKQQMKETSFTQKGRTIV